MAKDDYFSVVFLILKVLYIYKKKHERVNLDEISPEAFGINQGYRDEILEELLDEGYVKGFKVKQYITGKVLSDLENITITPKGIEYVQDNSKMKKVAETLKDVAGLSLELFK